MNEILLRFANQSDVSEINKVMKDVEKCVVNKKSFYADDIDFIKQHIEESGFVIVSTYHEKIIGFLIVRIPGKNEDNLGRDINLDTASLDKVAHMESVAVLKEYCGNGLQRTMISEAEKVLKDQNYKYAMATVFPENVVSLNNFLKLGYQIKLTKKKYGGLERNILLKII